MHLSESQKFTIVSAVIVAAVMAATSITASWFYRSVIIERESAVMHALVQSMAREEEAKKHLSSQDLRDYGQPSARERLAESFRALTWLPGFSQIKVFDRDATIVWSNTPELIGTSQTHHREAVTRALANGTPTAFNPSLVDADGNSLIEFYIPFKLAAESRSATGIVSLYQASGPIDAAIQQGESLVWLVTGLGGIVMYGALYQLFRAAHLGWRESRLSFEELSAGQERLIQLEKLSAMGQMVVEIAHQLNNPLVGVVNIAELAERNIGNQAEVKRLLSQIRSAGERCREYVERALRLGKLSHSERQRTDLGQLVQDTVTFFQQSLAEGSAVEVQVPPDPVICDIDPVLVREALFNLVHNAAQADPTGPIVVSLALEQRDGRLGCSLAVSDRGTGFPSETASRLFTPFFTTRPGGTGLGLSIVQHVAILHGGAVAAENRPEGGARFGIWIPVAKGAA
jgi:signal transduction histidine kinase